MILFSCKGQDPLTSAKVEGALGPKFPELVLNSLSPTDGQTQVSLKPSIVLDFSSSVVPLSVTVNLNSSFCIGSVQLSKDNFVTCEQLIPPISNEVNNSFTILPVYNLSELTYYKIKVTNKIFDTVGYFLSNPYISNLGFKTLDSTPPSISATFPAEDAVEVNQETNITLFFNEKMDASSITTNFSGNNCSGTFQLSKDSFFTCVPMLPPYNLDGKSFTSDPIYPLESLETYQIRALTQIKDFEGNHLTNEYIGKGFKVKDWTPPVVASTIPHASATEVSFYTFITASFSKRMDPVSIMAIESGNACTGSFKLSRDNFSTCLPVDPAIVSVDQKSFSFKPKDVLNPGTLYKFKFTTAVKDEVGLHLATDYNGSFTTAFLPFVNSTIPLAGAVQVPATSTLSVTFSETMDISSVYSNPNSNNCNIGTFHFAKESSPNICIPLGPVTVSNNSKTFTAKPILSLENQETYIIKVSKLVRSNAGYEMASDFVQNPGFRIYDTTPPVVEAGTSTPSENSSDFVPSDPITIRFDESMNPASMGGLYTGSTRTSCIGTIQLSNDNFATCLPFTSSTPVASNNNKSFTVRPSASLALSTNYKIKVTTAAQDKYGNYIATPILINFKTLDPVEVQSTNPPNSLSPLVPKDSNIQITFNRAVMNSSITFLTSPSSSCSGSIQVSKDNFSTCIYFLPRNSTETQSQTINIDPALELENYTNYKIRVLQSVVDENNISMASNYTQNPGFKTEDTIPPYVVSTTPDNNTTLNARNTSLIVNFDEGIDPLTISTNSTNTVCSGSLQVSKDNFVSCVQMTGQPIQDPQGMNWTMQPVSILDNFTYYKFKVLAGVKDTQGNVTTSTYNPSPGFQTIDDVPPTLISSSPASGTVGVPSTSNIVLTFSEAMNPSTITTSSSSDCGTSSVQLQIGPNFTTCMMISSTTSSSGNTVFTIDPTSDLGNSGTLYNLRVDTTVKDANGNPLPTVLNIPFRASDVVAPTVASYLPGNGLRVSIGSDLKVTFSEEIQTSSLITNQEDANCSGKTWYAQVGGLCQLMNPFTASSNNTSFLMEPQEFFPRDATVTVTIRDILDFQGNAMASPTTYSFTTDNPAQAFLVSPLDGATEVLTNSSIQVGFDVAMNENTLTLNDSDNICSSGNIQVSKNNFSSCIQFTSNLATETSPGSNVYQLTLSTELESSTTYTVRVKTGAKTTIGDSWPIDQDFSFTTVVPPTIIAVSPANAATNTTRNSNIDFTFNKAMLTTSITTNSTNTNCWGTVQVSTDNTFTNCLQMTSAPSSVGNVFTVNPQGDLPNESMIYFKVTTGVLDTIGQNMPADFNSSFKTRDEIQPTVIGTVPANLALNVVNNSTMTVSFSEPMNTSTITVRSTNGPCTTGTVLLSSNNFVDCLGLSNLGFTATNTTFNFQPSSNLPNAANISARVLSTVKDVAGNSMAANFNWSFTSSTVPAVSTITPASSATYVNPNTNIVVTFNTSMDPATFTVNNAFDCSNGNILFGTNPNFTNNCVGILNPTFSASNTTATFGFSSLLNESTTYYFKIKNTVSSADGMKPVSDFTSSFTTGDSIRPVVSSTIPVTGAINANENLISITFSEAMATPTITSGSATCTSGNIQVSSDNFATCASLGTPTTSTNTTFNFTPSPLLASQTSYRIKVKQTVTDLSGNTMLTDYIQPSVFTVRDYSAPTVISATPTSSVTNAPTDASVTVTFSEAMNVTTVTSNQTNSCDSSSGFLFSLDNFNTCLPVLHPTNADQTTFNFVPLNGLYNGVLYKYRINTSVKDSAGFNLVTAYNNSFTVNDSTANTVTMTNPTSGSLGVPFGAGAQQFTILFSAAVSSPTVTTNTGSTTCTGNVQLSSDNFISCAQWSTPPTTTNNLNFNLNGVANNLAPNTTYLLKVSKNITTTAAGKSIKKDYIFNFVTDVSPTVISLTPVQGTTTVPTWGPNTITVTFDALMDPSTIVGTADNSCGNTGVDLSINSFVNCLALSSSTTDNRTFYLTPTAALTNNTKYYLRITPKAKSATGNPVIEYYPSYEPGRSFTTTNKPTIVSTFPANGATGVSENQNLQIYFSEPMVNVTTNNGRAECTGTVQLTYNDFTNCVPLDNPINSASIDWYIYPRNFLYPSTVWHLKISGTVAAVRSNIAMGTDYIGTFTTGSFTSVALNISDENLNCLEESSPKIQGITPTKITWEKSKETLVNSDGGGYQIFYQKDDTNLYCKKIPYVEGEWAPSETNLNLTKGLWKVRLKSYSRLNPEGSMPSEIKKVVVP